MEYLQTILNHRIGLQHIIKKGVIKLSGYYDEATRLNDDKSLFIKEYKADGINYNNTSIQQ